MTESNKVLAKKTQPQGEKNYKDQSDDESTSSKSRKRSRILSSESSESSDDDNDAPLQSSRHRSVHGATPNTQTGMYIFFKIFRYCTY